MASDFLDAMSRPVESNRVAKRFASFTPRSLTGYFIHQHLYIGPSAQDRSQRPEVAPFRASDSRLFGTASADTVYNRFWYDFHDRSQPILLDFQCLRRSPISSIRFLSSRPSRMFMSSGSARQ